jgi:hypothetical protein
MDSSVHGLVQTDDTYTSITGCWSASSDEDQILLEESAGGAKTIFCFCVRSIVTPAINAWLIEVNINLHSPLTFPEAPVGLTHHSQDVSCLAGARLLPSTPASA